MKSKNTLLRFVASKEAETLIQWVNSLPFKIEIKGNPILKGNKFYLFFVVPDGVEGDQVLGGVLDG